MIQPVASYTGRRRTHYGLTASCLLPQSRENRGAGYCDSPRQELFRVFDRVRFPSLLLAESHMGIHQHKGIRCASSQGKALLFQSDGIAQAIGAIPCGKLDGIIAAAPLLLPFHSRDDPSITGPRHFAGSQYRDCSPSQVHPLIGG